MDTPEKTPILGETLDYQGYVINEKGEEILITEEMMADSMRKIKLKSIGAHTGHTKAVTQEMVDARAAQAKNNK